MFLKPKEGVKVFNPKTQRHLKPEGEKVEKSTYWIRRMNEGDVVEVKSESKPKKNNKKTSKKVGGE